MKMLSAFYTVKCPRWKVNAVCPGLNATGLNGFEKTEEADPEEMVQSGRCSLCWMGQTALRGRVARRKGHCLGEQVVCHRQSAWSDKLVSKNAAKSPHVGKMLLCAYK